MVRKLECSLLFVNKLRSALANQTETISFAFLDRAYFYFDFIFCFEARPFGGHPFARYLFCNCTYAHSLVVRSFSFIRMGALLIDR